MWLVKTNPQSPGTFPLELVEFLGQNIPPYAILSHTWDADEVTFADVRNGGRYFSRAGYFKVVHCLEHAAHDGLDYAWIDSLCINKDSSAELSEAINSMYEWYRGARVCYAYLSDVSNVSVGKNFDQARWWSRGWCLQELLAPEHVVFFSSSWDKLGTKDSMKSWIADITKIDSKYLDGSIPILAASVSRRMSWAASRQTTRAEDLAYCLMGSFAVNMPMLYGEGGTRAFHRLQEEIMKNSDDGSLFAWFDPSFRDDDGPHDLLADHPTAFAHTAEIVPWRISTDSMPWSMTNRGLNISLHLTSEGSDTVMAALDCLTDSLKPELVCIRLKREGTRLNQFGRTRCNKLFNKLFNSGNLGQYHTVYVRQYIRSQAAMWNNFSFHLLHVYKITYGSGIPVNAILGYEMISSLSLPTKDYEAARQEEVERRWPTNISFAEHKLFNSSKRQRTCFRVDLANDLSAAILFRREWRSHDSCFALLMGSMPSRSELGFDIASVDVPRFNETRLARFANSFNPRPRGTRMELPGHVVHVYVRPEQFESITVHLLEVFIESRAELPMTFRQKLLPESRLG